MGQYTYLILILSTFIVPFVWSFERNMRFLSKWKAAFLSILISSLIFIPLDILYTAKGVWGFNKEYLLGVYIANLPLEECLFFVVVPFSCLFIYECVVFLWRGRIKKGIFHQITLSLSIVLFIIAMANFSKLYTCFAFLSSSLLLAYHCLMKNTIDHEKFWMSYIFILIPFVIINGALTGMFTEKPVVWYNDAENLGLRVFTIPIDDFAYNLSLFLLNVTLYERFLKRNINQLQPETKNADSLKV